MAHRSDVLYLSPHLDDAVLSCGGRIWQETQSGREVLVVTVFTGDPPADANLTSFAQELHDDWELGHRAPRHRRAEDRVALETLGAEALHWEFLDCIYRVDSTGENLYGDGDALWGPIHPADSERIDAIVHQIERLIADRDPEIVVAPLGVGRHVDHRIVRQAAQQTMATQADGELIFFEDYPYADEPEAVSQALEGGSYESEIVHLGEEALERKTNAIAQYRSQISMLFEDLDEMVERTRAYASRVGEGAPAERYWRVAG